MLVVKLCLNSPLEFRPQLVHSKLVWLSALFILSAFTSSYLNPHRVFFLLLKFHSFLSIRTKKEFNQIQSRCFLVCQNYDWSWLIKTLVIFSASSLECRFKFLKLHLTFFKIFVEMRPSHFSGDFPEGSFESVIETGHTFLLTFTHLIAIFHDIISVCPPKSPHSVNRTRKSFPSLIIIVHLISSSGIFFGEIGLNSLRDCLSRSPSRRIWWSQHWIITGFSWRGFPFAVT